MKVASVFLLLCIVFTSAEFLAAQQNVAGGTLSGFIVDANGAPIAGASISATNTGTNRVFTVSTNNRGYFRLAYLPVGDYEISAVQKGFTDLKQKLTILVGQSLDIKLKMQVEDLSASVQITNDVPVVETQRTEVAETILPKDVENLPLNGRNFLDLGLLIPAVSRTNTGSVQKFAETSAVPGTGISVAGQRNLANSFIVDGSSANDDSVELAGTYYSQEVIREFQVVTNGAVAQFGRASAGFINVATQTGTNELRGKLYGFFRNDRLDARNSLSPTKDPLTQTQYGGSLGFPLIRNRTFFFGNVEQTRRNDSNVITIAPANVAAINGRLTLVRYPGDLVQTGLVPGGYDTTNIFARIDHQFNAKNAFSATYNFYDIDAVNARTVGGLNAVSRGTDLHNSDHTVNLGNITILDGHTMNELRFQYRNSRLGAPAIDPVGPAVNISGVASFGTATSSPTQRDIDLYQLSDSVTRSFKQHSLKFGAEFLYNGLNIRFPGAMQGVYTFNNLAAFLAGNYSQFQQAFGAPSQAQENPNLAIFVQDEWKIRKDLTLNGGLRYDLQFLPDPIRTDTNNISPRLGFAYSPNEKTVLRGSFGIYYDRIPTRATSNALQRDGLRYIIAILSSTSPGAPVFPDVLAAAPPALIIKPSITRIDPNISNSSAEQASLQIERELPWNTSISLGYIYMRGLNIILSRNVNVPTCADAALNLCRPDPNFGNISRYEGSGDSYYNGMIVSINKRRGKWGSLRLSYTFSKAMDDSGNFFFSTPQNNFDLRDDLGLSDNDQRHRLTISGTLDSPRHFGSRIAHALLGGFQFGYIFTYASRLPFNVVAGVDLNGDSTNNDRPFELGRNTGRGFDFVSFDLRLARQIHLTEKLGLELLVEGFNLFNRSNFSVPNATRGTSATPPISFGQPTAAFDPRQFQLGFRLSF